MNQPKQIITPWAENGLKNDIPNIRELSTPQEGATYQDGFPSITMTPISVGGKPPSGRDMNGILYEITANLAFLSRGKHYKFNQDYCSAINGYPKGAILINNAETALYISRVDQNQIDFNVQPNNENWIMLADTALKSELSTEINKKANIHSPAFTGTPTAPTPAQTVNNTQIATTEFVKTAIATLVGSAPAALDTLAELAQALGADANLKATLLAKIGEKATQADFVTLKNLLIGIPMPYPLSAVPSGCLAFNGQTFSKTTYPILAQKYPSGVLPDLRGEFIRGADMGRGVDSGRGLLSYQGYAMQRITGSVGRIMANNGMGIEAKGAISATQSGGATLHATVGESVATWNLTLDTNGAVVTANETRPRNMAFQYICLAA